MTKIEREKKIVDCMIRLYCRGNEGNKELCATCMELLEYSCKRLDSCKFGNDKPACNRCKIHCYRPEMREKIRQVMRYAGPRMIFHNPLAAIRHLAGR